MSAPETVTESRRKPLLTALFWAGIGLAPIAALLLLLADGSGALRIAGVLTVLAVVLIGLSIALRGDADSVRGEMEDALVDEIDGLREDLRNDIATAARATHKAFGEKFQVLQNNVEALRVQVEVGRPASTRGAVRGREREDTEAAPDESRADRSRADQSRYEAQPHPDEQPRYDEQSRYGEDDPGRTEYGSGGTRGATRSTGPAGGAGSGGYGAGGYQQSPPPGQPQYGMPPGGRSGAPAGGADPHRTHVPGGVVRHTETVQVTTRSTIVGPPGTEHGAENVYGGGGYSGNVYGGGRAHGGNTYGGHGSGAYGGEPEDEFPAERPRRRRAAEPDEDAPRTGRREPEQRGGAGRRSRRGEPDEELSEDEEYFSDLRAGDRWASVRSDERGRELRMGERRAAVRSDESGTELRVEDRWATVRQEDRRQEDRRQEDRRQADSWRGGTRSTDYGDEGGSRWSPEPRTDTGRRRDRHGEDDWSDGGRRREHYGEDDRSDAGSRRGGRRADVEPEGRADQGWSRRGDAPALPSGGTEPAEAWRQGRAEPADRRRRYADDEDEYAYPPAADGPRGGASRANRDYSEDRWR